MTMGITSPTSTTGQILKNGSAVISFDANNNATFSGNVAPSVNPTMRNRIINGAMVIDQRNAGASVTPVGVGGTYTLDRWVFFASAVSKYTTQQNAGSVTPPVGFTNYIGITSSSAYSVSASDNHFFGQKIEGYNVADLAWGTANAKTVTLSFQVYSSLTGTFGGSIVNSNQSRSYPFTYTISSANTWTQISVTIPGDTSGTWNTGNSTGLWLNINIGTGTTYSGPAGTWASTTYVSATGTVNLIGTNGATLYITGVQLEVGSVATPFEQRLYGQELALCQRYLPMFTNSGNSATAWLGSGTAPNTTAVEILINFPVTPRVPPTGLTITAAASNYRASDTASSVTVSGVIFGSASNIAAQIELTCTGATAFRPYVGYITASATEYKLYFTGCEL